MLLQTLFLICSFSPLVLSQLGASLLIKIGLQTTHATRLLLYSPKLGHWTGRTVAHDGLRARRRAIRQGVAACNNKNNYIGYITTKHLAK